MQSFGRYHDKMKLEHKSKSNPKPKSNVYNAYHKVKKGIFFLSIHTANLFKSFIKSKQIWFEETKKEKEEQKVVGEEKKFQLNLEIINLSIKLFNIMNQF